MYKADLELHVRSLGFLKQFKLVVNLRFKTCGSFYLSLFTYVLNLCLSSFIIIPSLLIIYGTSSHSIILIFDNSISYHPRNWCLLPVMSIVPSISSKLVLLSLFIELGVHT